MQAVVYLFIFAAGFIVGIIAENSFKYQSISVDQLAGLLEKDGFTVTRGKMPSGEPFLAAVMGKS